MAVVKIPAGSVGRLIVETGTDENGKPVFANRNYNGIKASATDEAIMEVMTAIGQLQKHTMNRVVRVDTAELSNE